MAEATRSRFSVDLDHIEQQLNQSAQQAAAQKDPLAELARIVGQDDPFQALLGLGQAKVPEQPKPPAAHQFAPVVAPSLPSAPPAGYEELWEPEYEIEPEPYHGAPAQPAPYQGYTLRGHAPADDIAQGYDVPPAGQDAALLNVYPSRQGAQDACRDYMPVDPGFAAGQP